MRLTHAEIYLNNFKNNLKNIRSLLKPTTKMCVAVKANGYGNGAVRCAKTAIESGADYLAIATISEGIELRQAGIKAPILMLSLCCPQEIELVIRNSITPLVFDEEMINLYDEKVELLKNELNLKEKFSVHIAIDSGMGRIGCLPKDAISVAKKIVNSKNICIGGMCTHFSVSDSIEQGDMEYTTIQHENFMQAVNSVKEEGIDPGIVHCSNSGATVFRPEFQHDMVRPGIIVYGYYPDKINKEFLKKNGIDLELKPVMALVSGICAIRKFEKGKSISYGRTYTTEEATSIGVIPVGYGDGFLRSFGSIVKPCINGKSYPIRGRICMDQCMIDLGKNPRVNRWDKVVLFGPKESGANITAQEIADSIGTIPYEILTGITHRVERIYIE